MVTRMAAGKEALAAEAWRHLLDYFIANRHRQVELAASFGLTMGDLKTLLSLDRHESRPMRALADEWKCDASNVTWLVDRLEERGLVERRALPSDRRVKAVALTMAGEDVKARLQARMYEAPDAVRALPRGDLDALVRILGKLSP